MGSGTTLLTRGMIFSWSGGTPVVPADHGPSAGIALSPGSIDAALRTLFGTDIWLDVAGTTVDRVVEAGGDWKTVTGEEAVRQSLLRRLITNPGDWKTNPTYGVGARQFVKRKANKATADELITRIRGQFLADKRVESVLAVTVEWGDGLMRIAVAVNLIGRSLRSKPLLAALQVR